MKASIFSERIEGSKTLAVTTKVAELRRQGKRIIDLGAGEPDFQTPAAVCDAGINAIRTGYTKYTPSDGIFELREAISEFLNNVGGNYSPADILVCNGAKHAIMNALLATCDPGDEVLIPAPYWTSYPEQVKMAGATPVLLPTSEQTGFKVTAKMLRQAITAQTKLLIFNSPSNPTGAVYTHAEIQEIVKVVENAGILILSDEIYLELIYDNIDSISLTAFPEIRDNLLLVNGLSKSHAMTGWRLGYLAAKKPFISAACRIQSHVTSNASSISQYAALAAYKMSEKDLSEMKQAFVARRNFVVSRLQEFDFLETLMPHGAFYVFPNIAALLGLSDGAHVIKSAIDFSTFLLEKAQVAVVPGEAFGAPNNIRISYATSMENLQQAMSQIENALKSLH